MESRHVPVLLSAVLKGLEPHDGGLYLDATLDGAGHAKAILEASAPSGRLIGLDMDALMLPYARARLADMAERALLINTNFNTLKQVAAEHAPEGFDGILADLGFSSNQIDDPSRGLAFSKPGPVDMRLDTDRGEPASELIRRLDERELAHLIDAYGEERFARPVARALKARLAQGPCDTAQLALAVAEAIPRRFHPPHTHPATRTFQALRIAVNGEMESLETFMQAAIAALKPGGRLAVISYHSLEDRRVRHAMIAAERPCICPPGLPVCACGRRPTLRILTRKPIEADENESRENPRARSAKLRLAERIAP